MARKKSHKDVDFVVDSSRAFTETFKTFNEACSQAVMLAASQGHTVYIDVLIHSVSGARWWGGDHAVQEYKADPEASVSERIAVSAHSEGRVA